MVKDSLKLCAVHGTTRGCAELIRKNGFMPGSTGYFGAAVYFFPCTLAGRNEAIRWAKRGKNASVSACIEIPASHFLDVTAEETVTKICDYHRKAVAKFDSDIVVFQVKKLLHRICLEMAKDRKINYNECVIHSIFPAIDGKRVKNSMKLYAVKGSLAKVTVCQVFNAAGTGVADV